MRALQSYQMQEVVVDRDQGPLEVPILEPVPVFKQISLQFKQLTARVSLVNLENSSLKKLTSVLSLDMSKCRAESNLASTGKQVLFEVAGKVDPGEVVGMMGPSGSGKTSLISILGGRKPSGMTVQGDLEYNGGPLTKGVKRKIGFVTQDDLMYATLTVYETLYYSARLRLPKSMSREDKLERVEMIIAVLGLSKCRDTLIGGPMMKGVSGGERKRVAVGQELLISPSVLLLDEPTSGLDATAAMHLLTVLRQLAEGGRSIITTIHQPSSRLYQQLDKVMLLSDGQCMYFGDSKLVLSWFAALGKPVPLGVNIADFMLDLANGDVPDAERNGEQLRKDLVTSYVLYAGESTNGIMADTDITNYSNGELLPPFQQATKKYESSQTETEAASTEKWGAGFVEQVQILGARSMQTRRFDSFSIQNFVNFVAIGFVSGLLWYEVGKGTNLAATVDLVSLIFFMMIFNQFSALFAALFTFPSEFQMIMKERSSGMYRLSAYYISRTASELPMEMFIPSLFIIIVYLMAGLNPSFIAFMYFYFALLLSILVGHTAGLMIGAALPNFKTATTAATLFILSMMLTGGFYVKDFPSSLEWVKYTSFIFYSHRLLLKLEFADRRVFDCGNLGVKNAEVVWEGGCIEVTNLQDSLGLPFSVDESIVPDVAVLFGILISFRVGLYFILKYKTKS